MNTQRFSEGNPHLLSTDLAKLLLTTNKGKRDHNFKDNVESHRSVSNNLECNPKKQRTNNQRSTTTLTLKTKQHKECVSGAKELKSGICAVRLPL